MIVSQRFAQKSKMLHRKGEGFGGQDVEQSGRHGECLGPVGWRHGGQKQEGVNDIINRANNAFNFTILRRDVWVWDSKIKGNKTGMILFRPHSVRPK